LTTVWEDISGNGNDMALLNNTSGAPPTIRDRSIYFDGTGGYGKVGTKGFLQGKDQITVEVCFKEADENKVGMLFEYADAPTGWNAPGTGAFGLILNDMGHGLQPGECHSVATTTGDGSAKKGARNFLWENDDNKFYTMAMVVSAIPDSTGRVVYINGKQVDFTNITNNEGPADSPGAYKDSVATFPTTTAVTVGYPIGDFYLWLACRNGAGAFFNGEIASVRIYARKLNPDEIRKNAEEDLLRFGG
jgi:hypothetical protein